jgi:hypothetical protein
MEKLPRDTPVLLLGATMVLAAAVTLAFTWHTTFFADTWDLLIERRDPSIHTLLTPHNEHLVAIPILINELFLRVFGMSGDKPELVLLVLMLCATAGLLYAFVERRMGSWPALYAAVLVLFLGPAFEVLLWPFEITFVGPMMFGLAAILALDRPSTRNDVVACVCLVLGLGFSNLGVPFILAGFVAVFLGPRERWISRAYIWAVPLAIFAVWYLGWGHEAESHIGIHNLLAAPAFMINMISVAVGSVTGLGTEANLTVDTAWGRIIAVLVVIGVGLWWWLRRPRLDRTLWPVLAVALANWLLAALNAFAGREPTTSRYQYAGAIFVLAILSCLLSGARPRRNFLIAGAVLVIFAVGPNIVVLHEASKNYKREGAITRADTAALQIAEKTVEPGLELTGEFAGTGALVNIYAGKYLEAVEEFGSPAYSPAELEAASPEARKQADVVLSHALPIRTTLEEQSYATGTGAGENCASLGGGGEEEVALGFGLSRVEVPPGDEAQLALRRFATEEFPVGLPVAPGESTTLIGIPRDTTTKSWTLHVSADEPVRVCR